MLYLKRSDYTDKTILNNPLFSKAVLRSRKTGQRRLDVFHMWIQGKTYREIGEVHGRSAQRVCENIHKVCKAYNFFRMSKDMRASYVVCMNGVHLDGYDGTHQECEFMDKEEAFAYAKKLYEVQVGQLQEQEKEGIGKITAQHDGHLRVLFKKFGYGTKSYHYYVWKKEGKN